MEGGESLILGEKYCINGNDLKEWVYTGRVGNYNKQHHFIKKLEEKVLSSIVIPIEGLAIVKGKIQGKHVQNIACKEINVEMYLKLLEALEKVY